MNTKRTHKTGLPLAVLLVVCGGLLPVEEARAEVLIGNPQFDPEIESVEKIANPCGKLEVNFNGKCRRFKFFGRFLTAEAELAGVAGPRSKTIDTGVVVVETLPNGVTQSLYILPDKQVSGSPSLLGRQYRAKYPVIGIRSVVIGQDPDGFVHTFIANQGMVVSPTIGFGIESWVLRTQTASGYIEKYSDGTTRQQIAHSVEGGDYCDSTGSGVDKLVTDACMGVDVVLSGVAGIISGAAVFVVATGSTLGVAGPEAAAAGVAIGLGVLGTGVAAGTVFCSTLGDFAGNVANDYCNSGPNPGSEVDVDDFNFLPLLPSMSTPSDGPCPAGMIRVTGSALQCGGNYTSIDTSGEIEEVSVTNCKVVQVQNECVIP